MAHLELSLAMGANPRSRPLLDGDVTPDGIDLFTTHVHPSEIFWRQLRYRDFDISEMSMSSLLMAIASGNRDWVGLPVFTTRRFFHTGMWVRRDAGIEHPLDLHGKRVGVPEYQQTAALWTRGILRQEWGVSPLEIDWYMERTEARSHGGSTGFTPPPGLRFNRIPPDKSLGSMLVSGELHAALHYLQENNLVDRSTVRLEDHPQVVRRFFPDRAAEGRRYFAKTGIYPINHGVVLRRSLAEQHPWIVLNIYNAFRVAKERWLDEVRGGAAPFLDLGLVGEGAGTALAFDPYPYGVVANRRVLETIATYSHEQGLTPRVLGLDEVFAEATLNV